MPNASTIVPPVPGATTLSRPLPLPSNDEDTPGEPSDLLVIVENSKDWSAHANETVVSAADYLSPGTRHVKPGSIVINLCRSVKYLSIGYYCSLLAEARKQHVYPSVKTVNDLSRKAIYSLDISDLDAALNSSLSSTDTVPMPVEFSMDVFFGSTDYTPLAALARQIFEKFPVPLMRIEFEHRDDWKIQAVKVQNVATLCAHQTQQLTQAFDSFRHHAAPRPVAGRQHRYQIAILQNPEEALPPSNPGALDKFIAVGHELGVDVSLIEKKDFNHIAEYDALFIRETTAINHHTYRFAKKAESEGLVVIDDPVSILRCTNKIYLADLLRLNDIPTPRTYVLQEDALDNIAALEAEIGYPMVMKVPDGAFSRGVSKAANREEFYATAQELLKQSSLMLVQEYLYTEFDWRIGVLNQRPIFASQYFMSKGHWQVAKRDASGKAEFGMSRAMPLDAVPPELLRHAVQAANLIGDGLYGVDMKMTSRGPVVIEVNDNPNIDQDIEDSVLGDALYRIVLEDFLRRLELRHQHARLAPALAVS
ncbi:glutathione synthase/RimK-type ligase-like ATP-grasp enzyme [Herbaspirillum sp. Sphag1AN]|uniref:RimK family protein n=1 Tax=unclassified Herbaspirillum TaxID=2624150 RepID=UPI0016227F43|nr:MULTISPECIES: RimK family protein [unclassified Herbaspirillum]MBB3214532.1 glutathione synthase/RimK-type ligase-like ATP-grasp enzyme [Herbaspirillum sp. Sphag1AN]MBB3247628.1 glutathione synthase/RimK-type ligase-like ATP-grasp enzyme [Herbaspirillum sp. Sphag64]